MKNKKYISALLAATLITSCSTDELFEAPLDLNDGDLVVRVEDGRHMSRAGFTEESTGNFFWTKGDQVGVAQPGNTSFYNFSLASGAGTSQGKFVAVTKDNTIGNYIVYPYSASHQLTQAGKLTYHLPATYEYVKAETDFHSVAPSKKNSFNPAMAGKIVSQENASVATLQQLGGVFCVKINNMPKALQNNGVFTLIADKGINGNFNIDLENSQKLVALTSATDEQKKVSIKYNEAGSSAVFYVPVPTDGNYSGLRIEIAPQSNPTIDNSYFAICGDFKVGAGSVYSMDIQNYTLLANEKTLNEAQTELENSADKQVDVAIKEVTIEKPAEIVIPAPTKKEPSEGEKPAEPVEKKIAINNVADGATLNLKENSSETTEDKGHQEVTLAIPFKEEKEISGETGTTSNAPSVSVTMPNSTVKLEASSGAATFNEITANTKTVTNEDGSINDKTVGLELNPGVKVNTLKVEKGNISIKSGAKINSITYTGEKQAKLGRSGNETNLEGTELTRVFIIVEEGAEIPEADIKRDWPYIALKRIGVAALKYEIANGSHTTSETAYKLDQDLDLRDKGVVIPEGKAFYLDLNGHKLTADNSAKGNITVDGGKLFIINTNTVTVGKIESTSAWTPTFNEGVISVINNGEFTLNSGNIRAIAGSGVDGQNAVIVKNGKVTINEGTINAGWAAIVAQKGSIVEINNDSKLMSSSKYVLDIQGGAVTINNGEFGDALNTKAQGSINMTEGSLNIINGTFIGNVNHTAGALTIENGTFNGDVNFSEGVTLNAGNFQDPSVLKFAKNDQVEVTLTNDFAWKGIETINGGKLFLAGKKVTINKKEAAQILVNGVFTITGGSTSAIETTGFSANDEIFKVADGKTLTLEAVKMTTKAIAITTEGAATVNINSNSDITAGTYALKTKDANKIVNATISSSKLTANTPIYFVSNGGELKLTGSTGATLNGTVQGVYVYGGILTMDAASTINMDFTKMSAVDRNNHLYYETSAWGEGTEIPSAGIVLGNRNGVKADLMTKATINQSAKISSTKQVDTFAPIYIYANAENRKVRFNCGIVSFYTAPRFEGLYVWVNGDQINKDLSGGGEGMDGVK